MTRRPSHSPQNEMLSVRERNSRSQVHLNVSALCSEFENIVQKEGKKQILLKSLRNVWERVCSRRIQL